MMTNLVPVSRVVLDGVDCDTILTFICLLLWSRIVTANLMLCKLEHGNEAQMTSF
jgi:hypothetical protein